MRVKAGPGPVPGLPLLALLLLLGSSACAVRSAAERLYPGLAKYAGQEIKTVRFQNTGVFSPDTLGQMVQTRPSECAFLGLPICLPFGNIGRRKQTLDPATVADDVERLRLFYRIGGFFEAQIQPVVDPAPGDPDDVRVTFDVVPGDSVVLDSLRLTGLDTVLDAAVALKRLPLQPGRRFNLGAFAASADTLGAMMTGRGHAFARVLRNYSVDTVTSRAMAELAAIPGPIVRIDTILVVGVDHLTQMGARRQLTFHRGDLLLGNKLVESQRNLYSLEIVQIATVSVAPDSLQRTPLDSSTATVIARVVEAPEHQVEAAVGWGRIDCFRTDGNWVDRSFGRGARRLAVNGALSKLGVGQGLGGNVCPAFRNDTLSNRLDYRFEAELTQPYFLSPRNHLSVSAYAERQSEPTVFQRTDRGGSFSVTHLLTSREFLTLSLNAEQGQTLASPVLFCSALLSCESAAIDLATRYRWLNRLSTSFSLDRTDVPVNPSRGFNIRSTVDWAAGWLRSSSRFTRWTGEIDRYDRIGSGTVLATALRAGTFFQTGALSPESNFLPPEERFYAGGQNTVRGYDRNQLGPGVWFQQVGADTARRDTTFVPTGGRTMGLINLELRTPSPILRERLSLAWFVDAGAVGSSQLSVLGGWRATPGVGIRAGTPVGPFRLDIAFNPYPSNEGALYQATGSELVRVSPLFRPAPPSFLGRLHFTLAVGQAF